MGPSSAGTNLKVGASVRRESGGTSPAQSAGKNLVVLLHFFGSKSTISRFGERISDGQYSLISFSFAVLLRTVPRAQPFVKVGGRAPVPMEAPLMGLCRYLSLPLNEKDYKYTCHYSSWCNGDLGCFV